MNPYLLDRPALISFSGGRTSGFMLRQILDAFGGTLPDDVIPVFANTGLEDARTYAFIDKVAGMWTDIVVLERRRGQAGERDAFDIRSIDNCSRNGEPFTALLDEKQFLPNPTARICTQYLKIKTMAAFGKSRGWKHWSAAIGLRADEPRRVAKVKNGEWDNDYERVLPMADANHGLEDVTAFWSKQPFDLAFPPGNNVYGNCVGCFLKSRQRIDTIARESPSALAWWVEQERKQQSKKDFVSVRFRYDRPSYAAMLKAVQEQPLLFSPEEESLPCDCHS
jgi:3'-phosphoadenosine 5'-phosphosulfate sulfotransferase (PAPS reductase)/FAD synthetase